MASEVYFTTNPADFTQLEGLYVAERPPPGFIRGADLSVVGMAGRCVRGPLAPQEITSGAQFLEIYGGRDQGSGGALVGEVWKGLINKKFGRTVVRRVAADAAVKATVTLSTFVRVDATSVGAWGNNVTVSVEAASDADADHFNLRVNYLGKEVLYRDLDASLGGDNLAGVIGTDPSNLVTVTKLLDGRPVDTVADAALAAGADGTLAAGDYIDGITDIANYQGVSICLIPEAPPTPADVNSAIVALAAETPDRVFLVWAGSPTINAVAAEKAALTAQITTRNDRIIWCYNPTRTRDPVTKALVDQGPHLWMACILANTDVDIHPGAHETSELLAGIVSLQNEAFSRADLISLRNAGICALEKLPGEFLFRSGVTTSLTPGKTEISRRRMTDFLIQSAAERLKYFVKAKNTSIVRAQQAGELVAFSKGLQGQGRIIDEDNDESGPGFIIDQISVNTPAQRSQGLEKMLWRVRLISHQLHLVLEVESGTGVVIEK